MVTGIFDERGTAAGTPFHDRGRFTDTFVRRDGKWLCVATHTSAMTVASQGIAKPEP